MQTRFLGAARQVTGSCYLVQTDAMRFLVDFVLLTHAHIDHSGLLPHFVAPGPRQCYEL